MSDGQIIIETSIDQTGADRGRRQLESNLNNTSNAVESRLKNLADGAKEKLTSIASRAGEILKIGATASATALSAITAASVKEYANYEQLVGGVETLFGVGGDTLQEYAEKQGKSVDEIKDKFFELTTGQRIVLNNAEQAYKTAGLSANEYMETITGFSASLLQSLGGDTKKAAELGNQAVIDMSDNANKMGTDMSLIQNAYQGFAKQNYTMLDNLKLGYGGTKEEMQRLLTDAEKLTGKKFNLSNFGDIVEAIHAIQTQMGITGTTSKEAMSTIEGSMNMVKASWKNVLTAMADDEADFDSTIDALVESVGAFGENILPRIEIALNGVASLINNLLPKIASEIPKLVTNLAPTLIESVTNMIGILVQGIIDNLPMLIDTSINIIRQLIDTIKSNSENFKEGVRSIINAIAEALPEIIPIVIKCLGMLVQGIIESIPLFIEAGGKIINGFIEGLKNSFPELEGIFNLIEDTFKFIIDNSELVTGALLGIGTGIAVFKAVDGISEFINYMKEGKLAVDLMAKAQQALNFIMELNPYVLAASAIAGLVAGIIYLWNTNEDFRNFIAECWEGIKNAFKIVADVIVNFFTETIPNAFNSFVEAVGDFIDSSINSIVNFFTETIPNAIQSTLQWFEELPNQIGYWLGYGLGTIIQWGIDVYNYLVNNVPLWIESVVSWFAQLPGKIWSFLSNCISSIINWGSQTYNNAIQWVSNTINNIINWFSNLPSSIWNCLINVIQKVIEWGSNLARRGYEAGESLVRSVVNVVSSLPSKMLNIGKNIVQGMWNGIVGAKDWLVNKITGFASSVVDGFKSALGIHSPSRVMRDMVGRFIPQGIGVGIDMEMPNLSKQLDVNINELYRSLRATVDLETANTTAQVVASVNYTTDTIKESDTGSTSSDKFVIHNIVKMNDKVIAEYTAPAMNKELGSMKSQKERWGV